MLVQEREHTERFRDEVTHSTNYHDRLLNTAQLRSTECIRQFATSYTYPNLALDELLEQAVEYKMANERDESATKAQKAATKVQRAKKAAEKLKRTEAKR